MNSLEIIKNYFVLLKDGNWEELRSGFSGLPNINTPMNGQISGENAFMRYITDLKSWLVEKKSSTELFNIISHDNRHVIEFILNLYISKKEIGIPVVLAADIENGLIECIRVYYSLWPIIGKHTVRKPLLKPAAGLEEPQIIKDYMEGLKNGDKESVVSLFEEDGYVREPSGAQYRHEGKEGLEKFYSAALGNGGIPLKHCTATFDGTCCAIEYVCDEWGGVSLEPQAGVAVYEIGESGKLVAARIYDDVAPPHESEG